MKVSLILTALGAAIVQAAYPGDIVQYWVDQTAVLVNGSIIGGLQSPPLGWCGAIVQGAVYIAAINSQNESLAFQQLAASHAAHDTLISIFHGTRLYATVDSKLKAILGPIGIDQSSVDDQRATDIGRKAAVNITIARSDDGINHFVDFVHAPAVPGVYEQTPGGSPLPDNPQARYIRPFGGLGDATRFRAPPPPSVNSSGYEDILLYVKQQGERNSTLRRPYDTETAYFWREYAPIGWNRLANGVVGNSLATDVVASARFYAQLNYALANAAIACFESKFFYNTWRPVTAIRRTDIWLPSGSNVSDPAWTPLLTPTSNHQDYLSTHATFGAAAAAVIRDWNGGDDINVTQSSNVTLDNVGVITRRITNISDAAKNNGDSRVFGGVHFQFASDVGRQIGDAVGRETLTLFDQNWANF